MKQKGRYNISVAQKHNVTVKESDDIDAFYGLVSQTGKRDAFGILPKKHYEKFLSDLSGSFLLIARHDEKPIAALLGVAWDKKATYYYGASSYDHRALMAPYLIQWEAMRLCKQKGCTEYDLFGIKPPSESDNHPWSGVSAF